MPSQRMSFKEMCAHFDVTPRTLRYYEYIELLNPEREGRARFYGPSDIARLTLILRGRRVGYQLDEIRRWLLLRENEGSKEQIRVFLREADPQIAKLEEKKQEIQDAINELTALRDIAQKGFDNAP